jgi:hypothetical protein
MVTNIRKCVGVAWYATRNPNRRAILAKMGPSPLGIYVNKKRGNLCRIIIDFWQMWYIMGEEN